MSSYGEAHKVEIARTLKTYERLFAEFTDDPPDLDRAGTEALERTAAFAPCHPPPDAPFGERYATLATVALDLARGTLTAFAGGPCQVVSGATRGIDLAGLPSAR